MNKLERMEQKQQTTGKEENTDAQTLDQTNQPDKHETAAATEGEAKKNAADAQRWLE